ncbi:E3 ubiquitin ligase TRAF3IP2 isoform X5 [Latimeria chalumnae]|uniref:E3 ubiquitin ligase TRAF3IP2 isoform X5 n=1 Tax=Latimeria chalumnae TaxID=7897 RepID=UPI0003C164D5|nr:PREDICTED: adapter protein CIKS-like isoform X6 [Latimeria chalumnae]|eukprot:XP_005999564.1 PREDICTED: adapter protein CIKS-like isoform X6 [Latimeria chalumnae]
MMNPNYRRSMTPLNSHQTSSSNSPEENDETMTTTTHLKSHTESFTSFEGTSPVGSYSREYVPLHFPRHIAQTSECSKECLTDHSRNVYTANLPCGASHCCSCPDDHAAACQIPGFPNRAFSSVYCGHQQSRSPHEDFSVQRPNYGDFRQNFPPSGLQGYSLGVSHLTQPQTLISCNPRINHPRVSQNPHHAGVLVFNPANEIFPPTPRRGPTYYQNREPGKVFVTYTADDDKHVRAIINFVGLLIANGFETRLDVFEQNFRSISKIDFMEQFLNDKEYLIIVVISPKYHETVTSHNLVLRNDESALNAVYIYKQLQNEFIQNGSKNFRFVPILFPGATMKHVPPWLQNTHVYRWPQQTQDILRRLMRLEKYNPPPIGELPTIVSIPI